MRPRGSLDSEESTCCSGGRAQVAPILLAALVRALNCLKFAYCAANLETNFADSVAASQRIACSVGASVRLEVAAAFGGERCSVD